MPTTTTGLATSFIQFSRPGASGGGATVTDADGKIKWAGHNLLTNSESFDASAWVKGAVTITANSSAAPNGTTTADRLQGTSNWYMQQNPTLSAGVAYTFAMFVKSNTGSSQTFRLYANDGVSSSSDLTATTSWQLFTHSFTFSSGGCGINRDVAGNTGDLLIWGAHLYRSELGGMQLNPAMPAGMQSYYPTTPRNLLGFTEDWTAASWLKSGLKAFGSGSTANAIVAPNGLQTADLIVEDTGTSQHSTYQSVAAGANATLTGSVYVKSAGRQYVGLMLVSSTATTGWTSITVDLAAQSIVNSSGATGTYVSSAISSAGDGWYRISITGKIGANTDPTLVVSLSNVANPTRGNYAVYSYTGDGVSGIYLWGAQLSDSASLDTYVPQYGAAVTSAAYYAPRLDFDSVTLAARGLLVEELRGNAVTHSSDFTQWSQGGSSAVTANVVVAPDGTTTADDIERVAADSDRRLLTVSFTGDGSKACSVYVKYKTSPSFLIRLYDATAAAERIFIEFTFSGGVPSAGTPTAGTVEAIENVGGGWYRIKLVASGVIAANSNQFMLYPARAGSANGQKTTFWGAQAEVQNGAFSTSLIPTNGATATRAADVASVSTGAFPYSASEGTLVASGSFISLTDTGVSVLASLNNNASTNSVNIYRQIATTNLNVFSGGSSSASYLVAAPSNPVKAAIAYKLNDVNAAVNGTAQTADTTAPLPTGIDRLNIGWMWNFWSGNGWIRQITYIPRRLSDAELAARTA